jgi:hypothetical protein
MLQLAAWFWYCYDDALAEALSDPAIGNVHYFLWFIVLIIVEAIAAKE